MAKIIQEDFIKSLLTYLMERPAKEVMSGIIILQNLPDAPEEVQEAKKE